MLQAHVNAESILRRTDGKSDFEMLLFLHQ